MSKRIKTKYTGIFYRETTTNNKPDKVYYIVYKDHHKTKELKIGKFSEGIRENYCNQKRKEFIVSLRNGELPPMLTTNTKLNNITFNEIAKQYFDAKELHNRTNHQARSKYKSQLQHFIGKQNIYTISKQDILKIQTEMAKTRSPKTVNQYIQFIRAVYNFAIDEEIYIGTNPTKGIKEQKVDNKRERFLTIPEIKLLLNTIKDDKQLHLFTLLSLATGGRLGTIMHISKKDIDFENFMITLFDIKNNDTYGGFFDKTLKDTLFETVKELSSNDKIIQMNERTLRRKLGNIINQLFNKELDKDDRKNRVVIHTLRHTFASHLAIAGTPIFTIQNLLNHKDIKQTLRYAKLAPDSGKTMINDFLNKISQ
jgi:site-specific recombinase XerD